MMMSHDNLSKIGTWKLFEVFKTCRVTSFEQTIEENKINIKSVRSLAFGGKALSSILLM
jgi:hypothetical protein